MTSNPRLFLAVAVLSLLTPCIRAADVPDSKADEYTKNGCRVLWKIDDSGKSTLLISRPLKNRDKATDSLIRHNDGTVEFRHDLTNQESVEKAMMGEGENASFDRSRNTLLIRPKKGEGAKFTYGKFAQFPLTIDAEFEAPDSDSGNTVVITVSKRNSNIEFPVLNLVSTDRFDTVKVSCGWVSKRDAKGGPSIENVLEKRTITFYEPQEIAFTIPQKKNDDRYMIHFGVHGESPIAIRSLSVVGRLYPAFGMGFDDKSKGVNLKSVSPKGLGDTIGMKVGDTVISINGNKPTSMKEAMDLLAKIQFGEQSEIVVKRTGKTVKIGFTAE